MPPRTHTVTFTDADDGTTVVTADDFTFPLGVPVPGVSTRTVRRLRALRGLTFHVPKPAPRRGTTPKE